MRRRTRQHLAYTTNDSAGPQRHSRPATADAHRVRGHQPGRHYDDQRQEGTKYQTFTGGGASFTTPPLADELQWRPVGGHRDATMKALFDPVNGIGLDFLRNPMGASDLARYNYSYDDMPAGQTDPTLANFSIAHDLVDVIR